MPFDNTGFRVLTQQQERDLAVLKRVRLSISQPGAWCQHHLQIIDDDGTFARCLQGWLENRSHTVIEAQRIAQDYLVPLVPQPATRVGMHRLVLFNDRKATKQKTVVRLLDRAIAKLEGGELCR